MNPDLNDLSTRASALASRFAEVGAKLADAARELQDTGAAPGEALVEDLAITCETFLELRASVMAAAEPLGVVVPDSLESVESLDPVIVAIGHAVAARQHRAAMEQARVAVLGILDRVSTLVHRDEDDFGLLSVCYAKAAELRAAIEVASDAAEAQALTDSVRAFAELLALVEGPDNVTEEVYAQLEENTSRVFGAPLAVAAARGRLTTREQRTVERAAAAERAEAERAAAEQAAAERAAAERAAAERAEAERAAAERAAAERAAAERAAAERAAAERAAAERAAAERAAAERAAAERAAAAAAATPAPTEASPRRAPEPGRVRPAGRVPPAGSPAARRTAPPAPVSPVATSSLAASTDDSAQWWLAAWARWSGWKTHLSFTAAAREELRKYPYLLSVPIQDSPKYEEGLVAYGYSLLLDHVERQRPGSIANALGSLQSGGGTSVGDQLYSYLVTQGRLTDTYAEFLRDVLVAALPEPAMWFEARMVDGKDSTRLFTRSTRRLGESEQTATRLNTEGQRFTTHHFTMTLAPLTSRFFLLTVEPKELRAADVRITRDLAPSDAAWLASVPGSAKVPVEPRRVEPDGTTVSGLGRDAIALWIAIFNPDPVAAHEYTLALGFRKDSRTGFAGRGRAGA